MLCIGAPYLAGSAYWTFLSYWQTCGSDCILKLMKRMVDTGDVMIFLTFAVRSIELDL
jgi:hypothetical protein